MSPRRSPATIVAIFSSLSFLLSSHAELYITEFMADNGGSLPDSDGDSSDWIELFNSGPAPVELGGYHLTDDAAAPTRWTFSPTTLPPGGFLLVFASGKDRRVAGQELHTNFNISKAGGYLALVSPDAGETVAQFGTATEPFPPQFEDVSYGLMQTGDRTAATLLSTGAPGTARVPADGSLGDLWKAIGFDDGGWTSVASGVGYDENSTYVPEFGPGGNLGAALNGVNTTLYLRIPFDLADPASIAELTLKMKYDDGFAAYLNGTAIADANAPAIPVWNSEATANHPDGSATSFRDFDITAMANLLQDGENVLAIHGLNDGLGSSDMLITPELHAERLTDPMVGGPGFLGAPSPGALNGDTFDGFVADTKFSVDRGFFDTAFELEITTDTGSAEIRYTLDGSTPTTSSGQVYTAPVPINSTTVVRAIAHRPGFQPTNVDTHTYLFPEDVVDQPRMRTSVTQSASYGPQMVASLKAVPTISLVTQNNGFLNESGSNIREEYAASVEMIFPDGTRGFQENGGLSNYGGRFTNFRKKSFRVAFRSRFGTTKLRYPIFAWHRYSSYPPAQEFDAINLRSGSHDMSSRGAYMSNRFADDTMLDMGNIAPHGRFVHVYLNGNYWGQYHLRERWSADMASSYFGGPEEDYEAVNANDNFRNDEEVYDGDGQFWSETKSLIAGADPFNNAAGHIDIPNIIDFMLLWVSGNSESEFRAFGSGIQGVPFKFMMKDADGFLRSPGHSASHPGPFNVMSEMRNGGDPDFAMLAADRIHMHYFNGGAFTPGRNIERLQTRVDEARLGFISESARWGDRFREFSSWESYQNNLINNHFPSLTNTMISRFRSAGMYPEIIAPVFSQHGGSVSTETPVTMATDADRIYFTVDGSDPRLSGGAPNPAATVATFGGGGPSPVTYINTGYAWKYLDDGSNQGMAWRATGFDDSSWQSGPSSLGYGDDGEGVGTELSFGGNASDKHPTTYFRSSVVIDDPSQFFNFLLRLKYDDGVAVYLNGAQVVRQNLDATATFDDYANGTVGDEAGWKDFTIPTGAFVAGSNVLAIEVHQASGTSSDIRFDMLLRGETSLGGGDNVSDPIFFSEPTLLRSRAYSSGTGEWSALNEAFFTIDTDPPTADRLVISEFHYHPANPTSATETEVSTDRDDYEFLEFLNISAKALDLGGVRFEDGINFAFPEQAVLQAGARLLLVRDRDAFVARYGAPSVQSFEYSGRLSNDGEHLVISSETGDVIHAFTFNDQEPWPTVADGGGSSLTLVNPGAAPDHGVATNWKASRLPGGSPGGAEPAGVSYADWAAATGLQGAPEDDDDGDRVSNFLEFLFGTRGDLMSDVSTPVARVQSLEVDGVTDDYLTLTYRENLQAEGAALAIELSNDLANWIVDPAAFERVSRTDNGDGSATVTVRFSTPVAVEQAALYLRMRGG